MNHNQREGEWKKRTTSFITLFCFLGKVCTVVSSLLIVAFRDCHHFIDWFYIRHWFRNQIIDASCHTNTMARFFFLHLVSSSVAATSSSSPLMSLISKTSIEWFHLFHSTPIARPSTDIEGSRCWLAQRTATSIKTTSATEKFEIEYFRCGNSTG
jgi:hypothetical protein